MILRQDNLAFITPCMESWFHLSLPIFGFRSSEQDATLSSSDNSHPTPSQ